RENAHAGLSEPPLDHRGGGQHEVRDDGGEDDRPIDGGGRGRGLGAEREHHDGGDRAGTREHRHAERHDADVFLLNAFRRLDGGLALLAAPRLHHIERVETDQHPTCDLEGADRDAEDLEDEAATQREHDERNRARPRAAPGKHAALRRGIARRHREKSRDDRERIHDEEDRGEDEQQLDGALGHRGAPTRLVRMRRIRAVSDGTSRSCARTCSYLPVGKRIVTGTLSRTTSTTTAPCGPIARTAARTSVPSMIARPLMRTSSSPVWRPAAAAALPGSATARQRPPCTAGGIEPIRASTAGAVEKETCHPAART